ncbi:BatA domain-containing protein [Spirosoma sordidisoli]|uniref:Aerotolerance regulator N-terminal domain-containing protein n=1 Tax=Spirosoma sordidisoli TaxID=2502893 RepID=A0A4Q2USY9_9BACT|nr:BatA domain-containing protein [Spirosoma sordidisoli]RYC70905.1 hypothetical protein EQG79_01765 [Spirosoma sordidisoli]
MSFIEPALLWGALAIAIPIAIHFWHQKRGTPLPWAATRWLTERDQQQSRGLRLDNRWLLLVRCLLLLLLAALLAQPLLRGLTTDKTVQRIHLVQPTDRVTTNFRFELAEARRKGEKVYWATRRPELMNEDGTLSDQPTTDGSTRSSGSWSGLTLQTAIDQLPHTNTELHLYLVNDPRLADVPAISVPARYRLHTMVDSSVRPRPFLNLGNSKKLLVNRAGVLTTTAAPDPSLSLQSAPAHSGPLRVLLYYPDKPQRQTVRAALQALTDVYSLGFTIDEKAAPGTVYDWVLTNRSPLRPNPQTLYVVSGVAQTVPADNVVFTNESLTPPASELVASGQLPEWLGDKLVRHLGLLDNRAPLSQSALRALFVPTAKPDPVQQAGLQHALTLLLIVLLILERWIALTKNA